MNEQEEKRSAIPQGWGDRSTCWQFAAHTKVKIVLDAFAIAKAGEHNKRKRRVCLSSITYDFILPFRRVQRHSTSSSEVLADDSIVKIDIHKFNAAVTCSSDDKVVVQLNGEIGAAT